MKSHGQAHVRALANDSVKRCHQRRWNERNNESLVDQELTNLYGNERQLVRMEKTKVCTSKPAIFSEIVYLVKTSRWARLINKSWNRMPFSRAHFPTESTSSRADRKWSRAHCFIVMSSTSVSWLSLVLNREIYRLENERLHESLGHSGIHPSLSLALFHDRVSIKSWRARTLSVVDHAHDGLHLQIHGNYARFVTAIVTPQKIED